MSGTLAVSTCARQAVTRYWHTFITGLPVSTEGNNAILTFVDRLTKQAHFAPSRTTIEAAGTADLYQHAHCLNSPSRCIVSDHDPRFISDVYCVANFKLKRLEEEGKRTEVSKQRTLDKDDYEQLSSLSELHAEKSLQEVRKNSVRQVSQDLGTPIAGSKMREWKEYV